MQTHKFPTEWTLEATAELLRIWPTLKSHREGAAHMQEFRGITTTESAFKAKAVRMKLPTHWVFKSVREINHQRKTAKMRVKSAVNQEAVQKILNVHREAGQSTDVQIWDLKPSGCRAITGHDGRLALWCNRPKVIGESWCQEHLELYINADAPRSRHKQIPSNSPALRVGR